MSIQLTTAAVPPSGTRHVVPIRADSTQRLLGYLAALSTVLIWSGYFLSLRQGALSPLGTLELTLFRFGVPAVILLPLLVKRWAHIRVVNPLWLVGIALGAGLPFFAISAFAMGFAPVAHGSTLIPGTAPLFVTGIAVCFFHQPLSSWRRFGLFIVALGVVCLLWTAWQGQSTTLLIGQALFLVCSLLWALFTISVRQSGLKPLEVAAVVTIPSALLLLLYAAVAQPELSLSTVSTQEWLTQLVVQGIAVGLGAGFLYGFAISRLGAEITSALGSLTPVCATVLALLWLNEAVTVPTMIGLAMVTCGVIAASGLLHRETS
ncbi:DMT family transporter [Salinispirillum sp. LH 10-3-1]|uniref:DMT family transporter n=1 Tax=Salinispirillum sp. LH 10-3-1 TaxID=2952525 RepID=A0AB38YCU0_9GAMM